jgi:hypothetical protein
MNSGRTDKSLRVSFQDEIIFEFGNLLLKVKFSYKKSFWRATSRSANVLFESSVIRKADVVKICGKFRNKVLQRILSRSVKYCLYQNS